MMTSRMQFDWRVPPLVVSLGVLWGAVNQLIPPFLREVDWNIPLSSWIYLTWPLVMLGTLLLLARRHSPLVWAALGTLFAASVVVGWFGCYAMLLELGLTPQGEQFYTGFALLGDWLVVLKGLVISPWLGLALVAGFGVSLVAGYVRRYVPALR